MKRIETSAAADVVIHPAVGERRARLQARREELAALLEVAEQLERVEGPWLLARYDAVLGQFECALLRERTELAALRREIEGLVAIASLGRRPSEAEHRRIVVELAHEQAAWWEEVRRREAEARRRGAWVGHAASGDPALAQEVKQAYRSLARQLHPDAVGAATRQFERFWPEIQRAYAERDLERLRAIGLIAALQPAPTLPDPLEEQEKRLVEAIDRQLERIRVLRTQPPLSLAALLDDPAKVEQRLLEIGRERAAVRAHQLELEAYQQALLQGKEGLS
jgi:hypothetical protein